MRLPPLRQIDAPHETRTGVVDWAGAPFHELRLVFPVTRTNDHEAAVAHVLGRALLLAGSAGGRREVEQSFLRDGAKASSQPGVDRITLSLTAPPQQFPELLQRVMHQLREPHFCDRAATEAVEYEVMLARSTAGAREIELHQLSARRRWGAGHPYTRAIVPPERLEQVTAAELTDAAGRILGLQDAAMVFVGDLSGRAGDASVAALEEAVGRPWRATTTTIAPDTGCPVDPGLDRVAVGAGEPTGSYRLYAAAPTRQHPDHTALHVAGIALGGYFGSRLVRELRERQGAVYGVVTGFEVLHRAATLAVSMECPLDRAAKVREDTVRILRDLRQNGPDEAELRAAAQFAARGATVGLGTPASLASAGATVVFGGSDLQLWQRQAHEAGQLTPDDIVRVLRTYVADDALVEVLAD